MKPSLSTNFSRRHFFRLATSATVAVALKPSSALAASSTAAALIDTNVSIGAWPFRRCPIDTTPALVAKLRGGGVTSAWAGSLDALLHKDVSGVNRRLVEECDRHGQGLLVPMGALNPKLSGWEEELRRCAEAYRMPGVRLHLNYHGYTLADPLFARVLARATELGLLVQIATIMEDERTLHPLVNVRATNLAPLADLMKQHPTARVQVLNVFRTLRGAALIALAAHRVRFEIAMLEGVEGLANLLPQLPPDRLCFGSYAPVFYFESAQLKLKESVLTADQLSAVCSRSAVSLLQRL